MIYELETEVSKHLPLFLTNQRSKLTAIAYKKDIFSFIEFLKRHGRDVASFGSLRKDHIIKYKTLLEIDEYSSHTITRRLASLSEFLKLLSLEGLVSRDLTYGIKRPKVRNKRETIAFTDEEVKSILESIWCEDHMGKFHHAILSFAFGTGLRSSEIRFLKFGDIGEYQGFKVVRVKTKGDKTNEIPIHEFVVGSLSRYFDSLKAQGIILREKYFLFQAPVKRRRSQMGQASCLPIHGSTFDYILKKYATHLGVKVGSVYRVSPHSMRATLATSLLKSEVSIEDVQKLLNHSNVSTTQKYDKRKHSVDQSAALKVRYFK